MMNITFIYFSSERQMKHFIDIAFYIFVKRIDQLYYCRMYCFRELHSFNYVRSWNFETQTNSSRVQLIDLLVNFGALLK